jgi:hypothetical protein
MGDEGWQAWAKTSIGAWSWYGVPFVNISRINFAAFDAAEPSS